MDEGNRMGRKESSLVRYLHPTSSIVYLSLGITLGSILHLQFQIFKL